jgi:DNA-binding response OmpR family regulator
VDLVCYNLEKAGFRAVRAYDGEAALRKAQAEGPDAVVLDLMLPLLDGWGVLKRLRAEPRSAKLPVLMLTARGEETDKVLGLELGADDYLTKPFSPRELVARVRALLRRSKPAPAATPSLGPALSFEGLEIDPGAHEVRVKKKAVELTAREFQLLAYFAALPGRVVTRAGGALADGPGRGDPHRGRAHAPPAPEAGARGGHAEDRAGRGL